MKKLIQPMIVVSFILTATSAAPGTPIVCGLLGFLSLVATYASGLMLLGKEDKDWNVAQAALEAERKLMRMDLDAKIKTMTEVEAKASKALADLHAERRRGPLSE